MRHLVLFAFIIHAREMPWGTGGLSVVFDALTVDKSPLHPPSLRHAGHRVRMAAALSPPHSQFPHSGQSLSGGSAALRHVCRVILLVP